MTSALDEEAAVREMLVCAALLGVSLVPPSAGAADEAEGRYAVGPSLATCTTVQGVPKFRHHLTTAPDPRARCSLHLDGAQPVEVSIGDASGARVGAAYRFLDEPRPAGIVDTAPEPDRVLSSGTFCDAAALEVPPEANALEVVLGAPVEDCGRASVGTVTFVAG